MNKIRLESEVNYMRNSIVSIEIDNEMIEKIVTERIEQRLKELDNQKVFWTMVDLEYLTGCSEGYIKDKFFYDKRFERIRRKVGRKWLFPADETKEFLLEWLKEQPNE